MRAVVIGCGAVGRRAARQLHTGAIFDSIVVADTLAGRAEFVADALGPPARSLAVGDRALFDGASVVVLATGADRGWAERALEHGAPVVSVADGMEDVQALLELDREARERSLTVAVGAGFSPGLSCLLTRHAASMLDGVQELHVARSGTGGPTCARQHHDTLAAEAVDWRDGVWHRRRGGSGRELCWFPDPVGAQDCYRGGLPDAYLLVPAFPGVERVTARVAATRRDRLTAHLPMLRRPHPEGGLGAIRVEARGRRGGATDTVVLGAIDRPALAAGAVAAAVASGLATGELGRPGAAGLASLVDDPVPMLHALAASGVRAAVFDGVS